MRTIWKYELTGWADGPVELRVPEGARFLHFDRQGWQTTSSGSVAALCAWFEVESDPARLTQFFSVQVFGTGAPLSREARQYLGTVQDGQFVWHLYKLEAAD